MKKNLKNYLMLLSGVVFLLMACDPTETELVDNQIVYDGDVYKITDAGTDYEGAVWLYFDSGDGIEASFALHPGEGEYGITKSGTFTFAGESSADYGKAGTFSEGWFEDTTTDAEVISGTIMIDVYDDVYTVVADCLCAGGKKLYVNYKGALEYSGPTGTTTFTIEGMTFPAAVACVYTYGYDEGSDSYGTYIDLWGTDGITGDQEFECTMLFTHSLSTLSAGTYNCNTGWPIEGNSVYGDFYVDDYETDVVIGGFMSEGKVTVAISGDVYTITFDGVKLTSESKTYDITGAYTGTLFEEDESDHAKSVSPRRSLRK